MKFSSALAFLLSTLSFSTEARKTTLTRRQLSSVDRRALMRSAVKVNRKTLRRLEEADQEQQQQQEEAEEFRITGAHSIQFSQCVSLSAQPDDEDFVLGDLYEYSSTGKVVAEKSYVLFNVCETEKCAYYEDNDEAVYMVDLATYMQTLTAMLPQQRMNYCEACQQSQDYCQGGGEQAEEEAQDEQQAEEGQEEQQEEGEQEQEGEQQQGQEEEEAEQQEGEQEGEQQEGEEGGRRRLANNNQNVEVVDCNVCEQMQCFQEEDNNNNNGQEQQQVNDETTLQWVQQVSECYETGSQFGDNGVGVYAGFICNEAGTGVEVGLFLDDACEVYASMLNYKNFLGENDYDFFYNSQEIVTYPFLNTIDCADQVEYITPEEYANQQAEGQDQNQEAEEEQEAEANEYCQQILNNNALPLYDCNADGEEDQQEDEVEQEDANNYGWYTYFVSNEDADDNQAVCKILQTMEGEYTVVYNANESGGSGHFYDYSSAKKGFNSAGDAGKMIGLIAVVLLVIGAVVYGSRKANKSGSKGKKERLLSSTYQEGQMS